MVLKVKKHLNFSLGKRRHLLAQASREGSCVFLCSRNSDTKDGAAVTNEMLSLGDTFSTYFNRHLGGGRGVLCKLRAELRKES